MLDPQTGIEKKRKKPLGLIKKTPKGGSLSKARGLRVAPIQRSYGPRGWVDFLKDNNTSKRFPKRLSII